MPPWGEGGGIKMGEHASSHPRGPRGPAPRAIKIPFFPFIDERYEVRTAVRQQQTNVGQIVYLIYLIIIMFNIQRK